VRERARSEGGRKTPAVQALSCFFVFCPAFVASLSRLTLADSCREMTPEELLPTATTSNSPHLLDESST